MLPEGRARVWQARDAAQTIARIVAGRTPEDYRDDVVLRFAIERGFTIVGEALAQLRSSDPATASKVSALPQAVGLRNVLIHGYAQIDDQIVWRTATTRVTPLIDDLTAILDAEA